MERVRLLSAKQEPGRAELYRISHMAPTKCIRDEYVVSVLCQFEDAADADPETEDSARAALPRASA